MPRDPQETEVKKILNTHGNKLTEILSDLRTQTQSLGKLATEGLLKEEFQEQAKTITTIGEQLTEQATQLEALGKLDTVESIDQGLKEQAGQLKNMLSQLSTQADQLQALTQIEGIDSALRSQGENVGKILEDLQAHGDKLAALSQIQNVSRKLDEQARSLRGNDTALMGHKKQLDSIGSRLRSLGDVMEGRALLVLNDQGEKVKQLHDSFQELDESEFVIPKHERDGQVFGRGTQQALQSVFVATLPPMPLTTAGWGLVSGTAIPGVE